jgi:transposase
MGEKTAARIIGELHDVSTFASSEAAAAYAGLSPAHRQSGVGAKRTHLSKAGNAYLRKALYFPAIVAMRYNPPLRAMADRLASRGKPKMVIVGALMRKLITIAYAVLKSGQPFDAVLAAART